MTSPANLVPTPEPVTVLLVDDEPEALRSMERSLESEPYRVITTTSPEDALGILRGSRVDVVVSDERMPEMRGTDLLEKVAREYPWVSRILLTGHTSVDVAMRAVNQSQVSSLLEKPCDPDQLRHRIQHALGPSLAQARPAPEPPRFGALPKEDLSRLSTREQEVLQQLVSGRRVRQIGHALFVSEHTVRNHLKSIFRKLGVHSQSQLLERCNPLR